MRAIRRLGWNWYWNPAEWDWGWGTGGPVASDVSFLDLGPLMISVYFQ
jgi:hypothetical protein